MYSPILTEIFIVSIEAFSALLGVAGSLYLFILGSQKDRLTNVKDGLDSGLRHLRQIITQIAPRYFDEREIFNFEKWALDNGKEEFDELMEQANNAFKDFSFRSVNVDRGTVPFGREFELYKGRVDELFDEYNDRKKVFEKTPQRYFTILIILCTYPIIFSLIALYIIEYNIPTPLISGASIIGIDIVSILYFIYYTLRIRKIIFL